MRSIKRLRREFPRLPDHASLDTSKSQLNTQIGHSSNRISHPNNLANSQFQFQNQPYFLKNELNTGNTTPKKENRYD